MSPQPVARRPTDRDRLVAAVERQARDCHVHGSPFYGSLLTSVAADVAAGGPCAAVMAGPWDDPGKLAVPLRFLGGLARLVLSGRAPELDERWPPTAPSADDWPPGLLAAVVDAHRDELTTGMAVAPQTNEVGRSGALAGGFATVARRTGLPLRLLEIGASAGLNLRFDHFGYDDRGTRWGDPTSPVQLRGPYQGGPSPLVGSVEVAERAGCDLHPLDAGDPADALALRSFIWPDQAVRLARLDAALLVAARVPVRLDTASAADWIPEQLADVRPGVATVVFHSIVWQYLPSDVRSAVTDAVHAAGLRATAAAPLAWLRYEPTAADENLATLTLRTWPGGGVERLGRAGFHGSPVIWSDEARAALDG